MWRVVLLGAPGVGKGTQAELLGGVLGACALSLGDVFRAARSFVVRSPALEAALASMEGGGLVPDHLALPVLVERRGCLRCERGFGFLLDGFPRTVAQAQALECLLHAQEMILDAAVSYQVPEEVLLARLAGRMVCPRCQAVFHQSARPARCAGTCDRCGAALEQRADDRPETIRARLEVHRRQIEPLLGFYAQRGQLVSIDANASPAQILERTLARAPFHGAVGTAGPAGHSCGRSP
jgi:adenylate kinase